MTMKKDGIQTRGGIQYFRGLFFKLFLTSFWVDILFYYLYKTQYARLYWKRTESRPRNRKLSAKSKKKRGTVVDFFSPFGCDASKPFSAYSAAGMHAASSYLTNPMSQYYAAGAAMHEQGRVHQSKVIFIKARWKAMYRVPK